MRTIGLYEAKTRFSDRGLARSSFWDRRRSTLGLTYRISAYDASYLELALRRGLPLATRDSRFVEAATAAGVEIL